jgi:hypothetical protein
MKIDCLMGTYGRYALVCEALACFLQQSALSEATLLIYNQHPVPLRFDHPRVRVVNEARDFGSLREVRQRMHDLAEPSAEFLHWWDDDDLYLPWHLKDCLDNVAAHLAWKPGRSWKSERNTKYELQGANFEASWIGRASFIKSARIDTHPDYPDHPVFIELRDNGLLATTELGGRTSYIYRWDTGTQHLSGYGGVADAQQQRTNIASWRRYSDDVRAEGLLVPADMSLRWQQYLDGTKDLVTAEEWEANRQALGPLRPPLRNRVSRLARRFTAAFSRQAHATRS